MILEYSISYLSTALLPNHLIVAETLPRGRNLALVLRDGDSGDSIDTTTTTAVTAGAEGPARLLIMFLVFSSFAFVIFVVA